MKITKLTMPQGKAVSSAAGGSVPAPAAGPAHTISPAEGVVLAKLGVHAINSPKSARLGAIRER